MPRQPISDNINRAIEQQWANEVKLARERNRKPKAVNVWRAIHGDVRRDPPKEKQKFSLSHTEKTIKKIDPYRGATPDARPVPKYEPWHPWLNSKESPEDTAFLLRLNAAKQATYGQRLLQHEAALGQRLRPAVEGLAPFSQYRLVEMYAQRKFTAEYLGREQAYTDDLDGLIAYRAWLPKSQETYELAVTVGLIPFPFFMEYSTSDPAVEKSFITRGFPFLTYLAEHPGDFLGWSAIIAEGLAPTIEALLEGTQDKLDPQYVQWIDRFLKFWAGIQETAQSGEEDTQ